MDEVKRIYVSIPISGYDMEERMEKCEKARMMIYKDYGADTVVVTPFDSGAYRHYRYGMLVGANIAKIIEESDAVYFLADPKITKAREVLLEYQAALIYGKKILI